VVVIAEAIGAEPIDVVKSDSMLFANIEIHGGIGGIGGINLFDTSNSTLDHICVVPRPGALLGSVSRGLTFFDPLQNNHTRNSYATRTLDDAPGMGGDPPATVVSQPRPRQLVVQRNGTDHLPNGTPLSFVPIQRNVIRGTSNAGIDASEVSLVAGGGGAPSHGVTIQNNSVPAM
jgi:hypothetical protein